ncbi:unnamed protein product [Linum trigynum]|uniref:Uncharacterized protein n=1 Tax=Linum trigynum TaxID=586398 RepID=A0AAV2GPE6_9ROSI
MRTQLEGMGLDYKAPDFGGKAPSRPKKGTSKKGKNKSSSSGVKADAPAASRKSKGRSSPRRTNTQKAPIVSLVEEEEVAPSVVQPEDRAPSVDIPSDAELDIDDVPLGHKLKRKNVEGDAQVPSKRQRTSAEERVPEFVEKWLQPPRHRVNIACSDRSALERGSALGFAFHAAEVLRAPSDVQGANLWGEVARMATQMLLLAKNGALASEALRMGENEAANSLSVMRDDLATAQRRQAELVQACKDANLEAAKAISLVQKSIDEEKQRLKSEHEAQLESVKRAHHEAMAKLVKERDDLDKEAGAQRSEIDLLTEEKMALEKEKKILTRENKRRQEELEALKQGKATETAPVSDMALKAQASLNSILILKRKLEADHPTINWDVKEMANFVIDFMASGRPVVDPAPAPPQEPEDEGEDSGSSSESGDESSGEE